MSSYVIVLTLLGSWSRRPLLQLLDNPNAVTPGSPDSVTLHHREHQVHDRCTKMSSLSLHPFPLC